MSHPNPSLSRIVQETPAIDVHSHQGTGGVWQARSLWEILSYHWLATDLRCAGAPQEVFAADDMDPRDRVLQVARWSQPCRNTVNHWCFMNIAQDLYGFSDPYLDQSNWEWLADAVDEKVGDPQWEAHVLNQAGVEQAAAPYHSPARLPDRYFLYEYGEYLFCPGLGRSAAECLTKMGGRIDSAASLAQAIRENLQFLVHGHAIRALHVWVPLTWTYTPVEEGRADGILHKNLANVRLEPGEADALVSYTADCTAEACGELGVVVQLFCGSLALEEGGPQVSVYRPEWLRALVPFFSKHRQTQFDLFLATRPLSHEAAVLARNYPNLWVSGAWWQAFTPSTLSEFFRDRLEMLPMNKWNAFYSDGYCVEWVYGKSTLARNRLALALSELVEEELATEDTAADMARMVLYDNPRRLYLGEERTV
jgi:glucuronate isomerase